MILQSGIITDDIPDGAIVSFTAEPLGRLFVSMVVDQKVETLMNLRLNLSMVNNLKILDITNGLHSTHTKGYVEDNILYLKDKHIFIQAPDGEIWVEKDQL